MFADWDIVARKALSSVKGLASEHRAVLADFTTNKLPLAQTAVYNQVQAAERKRLEDLQVSLRQKGEFSTCYFLFFFYTIMMMFVFYSHATRRGVAALRDEKGSCSGGVARSGKVQIGART